MTTFTYSLELNDAEGSALFAALTHYLVCNTPQVGDVPNERTRADVRRVLAKMHGGQSLASTTIGPDEYRGD